MTKGLVRLPGALDHGDESKTDAQLAKEAAAHLEAHAGLRFIVDVLQALHRGPHALRDVRAFHTWFPTKQVLEALGERPDLRVRLGRVVIGSPPALLRRVSAAELAGQIELLITEDLPEGERDFRPETDRRASVLDLYLKYIDPADLAAYLPSSHLWDYESHDAWWTQAPTAATRALMVAEWKSLRRHGLLSDTELVDFVGDEVLDRELPLALRTRVRAASRRAARDGRPFSDTDLIDSLRSEDGRRDLIDELAEHVALPVLRTAVERVAAGLGIAKGDEVHLPKSTEKTKAEVKPETKAEARSEAKPERSDRPVRPSVPSLAAAAALARAGASSTLASKLGAARRPDDATPHASTLTTGTVKSPPPPPPSRHQRDADGAGAPSDGVPSPDGELLFASFEDEPTAA
jgi:hypothetical protein